MGWQSAETACYRPHVHDRRLPAAVVIGVGVILAGSAALDWWAALGLGQAFLAALIAAILVLAVCAMRRGRIEAVRLSDVTLSALVALCAGVTAWAVDLRSERNQAQRDRDSALAELRNLKAQGRIRPPDKTTYEFIVQRTEYDPRGTFDDDSAYERVEPKNLSDPAPGSEGTHELGERVRVVCVIREGDGGRDWYRLPSGNFMSDLMIKPAPYTGEPNPPVCPESPANAG